MDEPMYAYSLSSAQALQSSVTSHPEVHQTLTYSIPALATTSFIRLWLLSDNIINLRSGDHCGQDSHY